MEKKQKNLSFYEKLKKRLEEKKENKKLVVIETKNKFDEIFEKKSVQLKKLFTSLRYQEPIKRLRVIPYQKKLSLSAEIPTIYIDCKCIMNFITPGIYKIDSKKDVPEVIEQYPNEKIYYVVIHPKNSKYFRLRNSLQFELNCHHMMFVKTFPMIIPTLSNKI